jgi:catabolite regulation protein CreA
MEVLNTVTTYKIDGNSLIFFDKNNKEIAGSVQNSVSALDNS